MENNKKKNLNTKQITKVALCIALICVSSYISVPFPFSPVPITAQTLVINIAAIILLPKECFFALSAYILLGICGLPVFSGGQGGIGKILGPTGGYLIGYLVAAVIMSYILRNKDNKIITYIIVTICVGIPLIYIFGIAVMKFYIVKGIKELIIASVVPFLPGDFIKALFGSYIGYELIKRSNIKRIIKD